MRNTEPKRQTDKYKINLERNIFSIFRYNGEYFLKT